jgi:hypothetical protein
MIMEGWNYAHGDNLFRAWLETIKLCLKNCQERRTQAVDFEGKKVFKFGGIPDDVMIIAEKTDISFRPRQKNCFL